MNRKFIRIELRLEEKKLQFMIRLEFYADLKNNVLPNYNYAIYFVANENFFLPKYKKK